MSHTCVKYHKIGCKLPLINWIDQIDLAALIQILTDGHSYPKIFHDYSITRNRRLCLFPILNGQVNLCLSISGWVIARLWYLQCISNGDTTVLHKATNQYSVWAVSSDDATCIGVQWFYVPLAAIDILLLINHYDILQNFRSNIIIIYLSGQSVSGIVIAGWWYMH